MAKCNGLWISSTTVCHTACGRSHCTRKIYLATAPCGISIWYSIPSFITYCSATALIRLPSLVSFGRLSLSKYSKIIFSNRFSRFKFTSFSLGNCVTSYFLVFLRGYQLFSFGFSKSLCTDANDSGKVATNSRWGVFIPWSADSTPGGRCWQSGDPLSHAPV